MICGPTFQICPRIDDLPRVQALVWTRPLNWCILESTFCVEGTAMELSELVLWFPRWAWAAVQGAFWNYIYFWVPPALVFILVKWFLPASLKKRIAAWLGSTSVKYPRT